MIDRKPGQKPDEVELQRMRTLAEAGNPMYMYEYGRAVISQDPDRASDSWRMPCPGGSATPASCSETTA